VDCRERETMGLGFSDCKKNKKQLALLNIFIKPASAYALIFLIDPASA